MKSLRIRNISRQISQWNTTSGEQIETSNTHLLNLIDASEFLLRLFVFFWSFGREKNPQLQTRGLELGPMKEKKKRKEKKKHTLGVSAIQNASPYYTNQINHSANIVSLRGPMTASPVRYFH